MIRQYDALIQYYTRQDPDELTDEQWAILAKNIEWVRNQEKEKSFTQLAQLFKGK